MVSPRSFGVFQPLFHGLSGDPVDDSCEFRCLVIGEYLHPVGCQLSPDRCGGAKARILLGLAEHLVLHCLRGTELPQDANEETLLVD
jgi:hypothetical protein